MDFASRLGNVKPSATLKYAAAAKKPGVINLTVGRPDYDTPDVVKEAAKKALDEGKVHYAPTRGIPELREKIVEKLAAENEISGLGPDNVLVSCGAKQILYEIFAALVSDGDTVALPNPSWVSYESQVALCGGSIDWLPMSAENGFIPGDDFMKALEGSKAKILVIDSPNNPTGAVYPKDVLEKIVSVCKSKDMWLVSDEPYEKFIYEGEHWSPGSSYEKTITVNALSKTYSMTGWRVGYAACQSAELITKLNTIQSQTVSCATSFAQYGALACFTPEAEEASKKMVADFKERRDYVMEKVAGLDVVCTKPAGAFYVFPKFKIEDDLKLADDLLEAGVGTVPGSAFGSAGKGCLRISYGSANKEKLGEAFDKIKEVI